jgi:hypothetical protein
MMGISIFCVAGCYNFLAFLVFVDAAEDVGESLVGD